nr:NADH dehydrogenase subunit 4 [Kradibia gibbosae]
MMSMLIFMISILFIYLFFEKKMMLLMLSNLLFMMSFMMLFKFNYSNDWSMIYYWMGIDSFSFILIILSFWITGLMFLVSKVENIKLYSLILMILLLSLILCFSSMNYFIFYFFFEITLIPTFLLIMGWGYQSERINASMYLLYYCLLGSFPLLFIIFLFYNKFYTLNFEMLILLNYMNNLVYYFLIFAFLAKVPMFLFHVWLPKAHVEAPLTGSMILAGVLLKLGGYGLYRSMILMLNNSLNMNIIFMMISLMGMIYLSFICIRQIDMKMLVAYSSVVHMSMMLMSMFTMTIWGFMGGLLMMIGHGLCSSAMFVLVNYFYERTNTRNLLINKGMIYVIPSMCMWWFIFCSINMSAPISLNLMSEIMSICVIINWSNKMILMLMIGMFMSATYSLYLFSYSYHGKLMNLLYKIYPNNMNNFIVMILHWIPLNFLILKMDMFI